MSSTPKHISPYWSELNGVRSASLKGPDGRTLRPLTDYIDYLAEKTAAKSEQARRSAMDACVYALAAFATFLLNKSQQVSLELVTDKVLEDFRVWAFENVRRNPRSREFAYQAETTVNVKLRQVYDALTWLQSVNLIPSGTIGWSDCKVKSSAPAALEFNRDEDRRPKNKYPECFPESGENSRERPFQHFATATQLRRVEDYFWQNNSAEIATRNCLMLRILDFEGWRISSANSLLTEQFDDEELFSGDLSSLDEKGGEKPPRATFLVSPSRQKFGYRLAFEMPWELAMAVRNFIDDEQFGRAATLSRIGINETIARHRLFISSTDGVPLRTARWSEIFSEAFRAVGGISHKGAAGHSIRRGSGDRKAGEEVAYLQEMNLPVTIEAVSKEVAEFLGQSSLRSQRFYRRAIRRLRRGTLVDRISRENEQLKLGQDKLRKAIAKLTVNLEKLQEENERLQARALSKSPRRKVI